MFDHVTIRVAGRAASERFYETVLLTLGIEMTYSTSAYAEWREFSLTEADDDHPMTTGLHVGFVAPSREQVDAFWHEGRQAGAPDDGAPGPRTQYRDDYYGAFLRDPDGNSVEAVHHGAHHPGAAIDHLWIRVADVAAAAAFYAAIAPHAGFGARSVSADRATFAGAGRSFTLVAGAPTRNLHMAFGVEDEDRVRAFHAAALAAGYRDHGVPGERAQYHPGYYAAYVLDPDGNNIEVVDHHRV